jgi:hypothetical protein
MSFPEVPGATPPTQLPAVPHFAFPVPVGGPHVNVLAAAVGARSDVLAVKIMTKKTNGTTNAVAAQRVQRPKVVLSSVRNGLLVISVYDAQIFWFLDVVA